MLLKVVSYYDFSVLSMSVVGFQNKRLHIFLGGFFVSLCMPLIFNRNHFWGIRVRLRFILDFSNFVNFAKLCQLCQSLKNSKNHKKNLDRAHPSNFFFWEPITDIMWTEHSNHNNQQLLAMYIQTEHTWYATRKYQYWFRGILG